MAELGLNDHHSAQVMNYMRFIRYKRSQTLRAVQSSFRDVRSSRLSEDTTFTIDEVNDLVDDLEMSIRDECESELINIAHTNILLLRQLLSQSETWHLKLQADISELENRELITMVADFEDKKFSGKPTESKPTFELRKLDPMNAGGPSALLQMEIDRLNQENYIMKNRFNQLENTALSATTDKSKLLDELKLIKQELSGVGGKSAAGIDSDLDGLRQQMASVKASMNRSEDDHGKMEGDLIATKHKLLEIKEQLELAEKELDKKFSQTAAYSNMKQMLQRKNEQIKQLRSKLRQYEPDAEI